MRNVGVLLETRMFCGGLGEERFADGWQGRFAGDWERRGVCGARGESGILRGAGERRDLLKEGKDILWEIGEGRDFYFLIN